MQVVLINTIFKYFKASALTISFSLMIQHFYSSIWRSSFDLHSPWHRELLSAFAHPGSSAWNVLHLPGTNIVTYMKTWLTSPYSQGLFLDAAIILSQYLSCFQHLFTRLPPSVG